MNCQKEISEHIFILAVNKQLTTIKLSKPIVEKRGLDYLEFGRLGFSVGYFGSTHSIGAIHVAQLKSKEL